MATELDGLRRRLLVYNARSFLLLVTISDLIELLNHFIAYFSPSLKMYFVPTVFIALIASTAVARPEASWSAKTSEHSCLCDEEATELASLVVYRRRVEQVRPD